MSSLETILQSEDPVVVWMALLERIQARIGAVEVAGLTSVEADVLALYDVWTQARNGGLMQYLLNSAGDDAPLALAALARVGAPDAVVAFREAMERLVGDGPWPDRDARHARVEDWGEEEWEPFEDLTDTVVEGDEDLAELVAAYAGSHPDGWPEPA